MMPCQSCREEMVSYINGELFDGRRQAFEEHLQNCARCTRTFRAVQLVWKTLDGWEDQMIPSGVKAHLLDGARAVVNETGVEGSPLKKIPRLVWPIALGLLATIASAGVLSSRMNLSLLHPLSLTAVGALWTGLYAIIFYLLLFTRKEEPVSWRAFAQASLMAAGIFLIFTLLSPVPSSIHFCRYYSFTQPVIERLSIGGSFFMFGVLYALIPMGIAAFFSGGLAGTHSLARGSIAGLMFVVLLAPGIYLQCAPFTLGVLLVWFGGALIGSLLGGTIGFWIRYRMVGN